MVFISLCKSLIQEASLGKPLIQEVGTWESTHTGETWKAAHTGSEIWEAAHTGG